jgi:hypothetical protein
MPTESFLLRFQDVMEPDLGDDKYATLTKTGRPKEKPQRDACQLIPLSATKTVTEVTKERPTSDPKKYGLYTIPRR